MLSILSRAISRLRGIVVMTLCRRRGISKYLRAENIAAHRDVKPIRAAVRRGMTPHAALRALATRAISVARRRERRGGMPACAAAK